MKLKLFQKIICFMILINFVSCWSGSNKITDEIIGTYAFEFPSGLYELIKINKDSSYIQKYYTDFNSFKNGQKPFYIGNGKWSRTSEYQLSFENWLEYCDMSNPDIILPEPEYITQLNVNWYRASSDNKGEISIYSENGYVFEKID